MVVQYGILATEERMICHLSVRGHNSCRKFVVAHI